MGQSLRRFSDSCGGHSRLQHVHPIKKGFWQNRVEELRRTTTRNTTICELTYWNHHVLTLHFSRILFVLFLYEFLGGSDWLRLLLLKLVLEVDLTLFLSAHWRCNKIYWASLRPSVIIKVAHSVSTINKVATDLLPWGGGDRLSKHVWLGLSDAAACNRISGVLAFF